MTGLLETDSPICGAALDDVVGDHHVAGDDLDAVALERAVVGADHVAADGRLVALVDADPVVDGVVLDQRARAAAPDLDPQALAAGAAHAVVADHQFAEWSPKMPPRPVLRIGVAEDLVPHAAPGQADAAAELGAHADVLDLAVADPAVGHAAFHGRVAAGKEDRVRPPGLDAWPGCGCPGGAARAARLRLPLMP